MPPLGDIRDHLHLVRRMARATGTDLGNAVHEGTLTSTDWAQVVTNCRGCDCADPCRARLTALEMAGEQTAAPDYCRNRATFDRLARHPAQAKGSG